MEETTPVIPKGGNVKATVASPSPCVGMGNRLVADSRAGFEGLNKFDLVNGRCRAAPKMSVRILVARSETGITTVEFTVDGHMQPVPGRVGVRKSIGTMTPGAS